MRSSKYCFQSISTERPFEKEEKNALEYRIHQPWKGNNKMRKLGKQEANGPKKINKQCTDDFNELMARNILEVIRSGNVTRHMKNNQNSSSLWKNAKHSTH